MAAQNIDYHILKDIQIFQGAGAYGAFATTLVDQPSAGTYTYTISTEVDGMDIGYSITNNEAISITELKK